MHRDSKRLLLELEQVRKTINRNTINPEISDLDVGQLEPLIAMVAEVRASYIKSLFDLAAQRDGTPSAEQIAVLREQRLAFTELVDAMNAVEAAISRGYLDVSAR